MAGSLRRVTPLLLLAAVLGGCGDEPLLHDLDERQANEVLVALDEGGVPATKQRQDGSEAGWTVAVPRGDGGRAHRLLAARQLPRVRPAGLGDLFGKGGMVPTPVEEHARWLAALAGELARSLEALDGVVEARVHLGLPSEDALRPGPKAGGRAAVLLKCRPAACQPLRSSEPGLRALVAGAADGLTADSVAVVIAEAAEPPAAPPPRGPRLAPWLAGLLALAALGLAGWGWWERHRGRTA
jgi:type III secretion protein J